MFGMIELPEPVLELYRLPGFHEPFSAMSHLLGAVLFAFLGYGLLLRGRGDRTRLMYLGVYAFACVFLFAMSGVYHMMELGGAARAVLGRLDHSAIFVLIAGTFTPIHGLLFQGWRRWGPLAVIWGGSIAGICLKSIFYDEVAEWVSLSLYLGLGWLGAYGGILVGRRFGFRFIRPLVWGGIAYSVGAVFEFLQWRIIVPRVVHPHDLFHMAVLAGALFHWCFVWQFADGQIHNRIGIGAIKHAEDVPP
jgi:channel protein (hemolysin III family)